MKKYFILIFIFFTLLFFCSCATDSSRINTESLNAKGNSFYASGVASFNLRRYQEAKSYFLKALNSGYNTLSTNFYLGLIEYYLKNYTEAEKYLKKCVQIKDSFTEAHNTLGAIYAQQKKYNDAIKEFKKVLEDKTYLNPEVALYNIALMYYHQGKYDDSINYCNKSLYVVPQSPPVYYLMAMNYYKKKQLNYTIFYLNSIIKNFPETIWAKKAKIFKQMNNLD